MQRWSSSSYRQRMGVRNRQFSQQSKNRHVYALQSSHLLPPKCRNWATVAWCLPYVSDPCEYSTFLRSRPDVMELEAIRTVTELCLQYKSVQLTAAALNTSSDNTNRIYSLPYAQRFVDICSSDIPSEYKTTFMMFVKFIFKYTNSLISKTLFWNCIQIATRGTKYS